MTRKVGRVRRARAPEPLRGQGPLPLGTGPAVRHKRGSLDRDRFGEIARLIDIVPSAIRNVIRE